MATHEKVILKNWFEVLDALGGDITGDYKADLQRVPHVDFSEDLYDQAYQMSEQP